MKQQPAVKSKGTRLVRLPSDLSEKLAVLAWHDESTMSAIIEPMIRSQIEKRFASLPESLRTLAETRIAAKS